MSEMNEKTHFSIFCDYCGIKVICKRQRSGARTRKKYCSRPCAQLMWRLMKAEREQELLSE